MPWKSGTIMDSRLEFVRLAEQGGVSVAELCRRFGISRETGFQYLRRYRESGLDGLKDRSRRPHTSPRRTPAAMEAQIVELREVHPWGPCKLARRLRDLGVADVPAASTVSAVLRRNGKLDPAETAKHQPFERSAPNELWQMDFKGHRSGTLPSADRARRPQPLFAGAHRLCRPDRCDRARPSDRAVPPLWLAGRDAGRQQRAVGRQRRAGLYRLRGVAAPPRHPAASRPALSSPNPRQGRTVSPLAGCRGAATAPLCRSAPLPDGVRHLASGLQHRATA